MTTGPSPGKFIRGLFFKLPQHCCRFFRVEKVLLDDGTRADLMVKWGVQDNDDWRWDSKKSEWVTISGKRYVFCREFAPFGDKKDWKP